MDKNIEIDTESYIDLEILQPSIAIPEVQLVSLSAMELGLLFDQLYASIEERKKLLPEGSYTASLFKSGTDKILKKLGEEVTETIIATKNGSRREISTEIADLFYHVLVLMVDREVLLHEVIQELMRRLGKINSKP